MAKEDTQKINSEKLKALQLTIDKIEKSYGKGSIMRMGDKPVDDVQAIHSGSIALDLAMGIGGYPKGRVIEIFGMNHQEKQPSQFMQSLKHKKLEELPLLLMRNMLSTLPMLRNWALISMNFLYLSLIMVSKP